MNSEYDPDFELDEVRSYGFTSGLSAQEIIDQCPTDWLGKLARGELK